MGYGPSFIKRSKTTESLHFNGPLAYSSVLSQHLIEVSQCPTLIATLEELSDGQKRSWASKPDEKEELISRSPTLDVIPKY